MRVVTGTKFNGGRHIEVELEGVDGTKIFGEKWGGFSTDIQFKRLAAYADILVLQYLLRDGSVTQQHFDERVNALGKELRA
jgi:hypothetical protein